MKNLTVQEKLCTEPKATPQEALPFAIAFEEGTMRQNSYGDITPQVKVEPVCAINERKKLPTLRHGKLDHGTLRNMQSKKKAMQKLWNDRPFRKGVQRQPEQHKQKNNNTAAYKLSRSSK